MYIKGYKLSRAKDEDGNKPFVLTVDKKFRVGIRDTEFSEFEELFSGGPYVIGVDGSGSSTGIFVFGLDKERGEKVPVYAINFTRSQGETFVEFRVAYKNFFRKLLKSCKVARLYYEEPVIDYFAAVPVLYSLRTVLEEILVEDEGNLCVPTKLYYVANSTWKKWIRVLAGPKAADYPNDSKEFARAFFMDKVSVELSSKEPALAYDITDAFALGLVSSPAFIGNKKAVVYEQPESDLKG